MESLMTDSDGLVEETNIEKFWNDGFVILRNIIDPYGGSNKQGNE